jgi:seryl-tRNA synthetase
MDIKKIRIKHDEYKTNQKNRYCDITLVNKMIDSSNGWLEHKYIKDNIERKRNVIVSYIKKQGKQVTIDEDIDDIDFDDLITQLILGNIDMNRLQSLSTPMLRRLVNMLDEQIQLQTKTIDDLKYKSVVYLRQLGNLILPDVPISNISKFNTIRNVGGLSDKCKQSIDKLNTLPTIDYEAHKYTYDIPKLSGIFGIKSEIYQYIHDYINSCIDFIRSSITLSNNTSETPVDVHFIDLPPVISTSDSLRMCNIEELNKKFIKLKHIDVGFQFDPNVNSILQLQNTEITKPRLILTNSVTLTNKEVSIIGTEHKQQVTEYSKSITLAYVTTADKSEMVMDELCDMVERYYSQHLGCEWKSENVVSGCLEISSAKEHSIIGTTPINKRKIELAKIKHTTNYYSHKLNIKDNNGYDTHIIFVDVMNSVALYPFIVELYQTGYYNY